MEAKADRLARIRHWRWTEPTLLETHFWREGEERRTVDEDTNSAQGMLGTLGDHGGMETSA